LNDAAADAGGWPEGIRLRCPRCGASLAGTDCRACGFAFAIRRGILRALSPEAEAHFAGFIGEYERIRAAEGRGGEDAAFYLGLPHAGGAARDPRQWRIRARSHAWVLRRLLRGDAMRGARILDLGAGNCWMSHRLALAGHRPCAVDLVTNDADGMGAARHYRSALPALFPRVQASFERLPFEDAQFDAAIFNASFHYSEDGEAALREALRCVRPGGMVIVSDTPWYPREEDGRRMLAERQAAFECRHGMAGNAIAMLGFLTDAWLREMEHALRIRWDIHRPWYGLAWALRPAVAALRGRRKPSRFRLYVARRRAQDGG
jgi:SAM-dependent methyltransferase